LRGDHAISITSLPLLTVISVALPVLDCRQLLSGIGCGDRWKGRAPGGQQACRIGIAERRNDVPQGVSISKRGIEALSYSQ